MMPVPAGPRSAPGINQAVGDFVSYQIWGQPGRITGYSSLGVFDGEKLVAGVLYHNWSPEAQVIEMSAASTTRRWLTRRVLKTMFDIPFNRFDCQMVVLRVSEHNAVMLHIARQYGFNEYVIPRLRGRNEAEHILTLTKEGWEANGFHRDTKGTHN